MLDILASAQNKPEPPLLPVHADVNLPYSSHPTGPPPPEPEPVVVPPARKPRSKFGPAASVLLLLFATLPLSVYFVSQQRQLLEQRSKAAYVTSPNMVYVANLNKTSFSVVWKEQNPSKGCASATNTKSKKETKACDGSLSRMHLITLTNLDPYTPHEISAQGSQRISLHPFFGGSIITGLFDKDKPQTNQIKGKVVQNGKPLANVFVIITPVATDRFYFPVASDTDQNGEYRVDLSLIEAQNPKQFDSYLIEVTDHQGKTLIEQKVSKPTGSEFSMVSITN